MSTNPALQILPFTARRPTAASDHSEPQELTRNTLGHNVVGARLLLLTSQRGRLRTGYSHTGRTTPDRPLVHINAGEPRRDRTFVYCGGDAAAV